MIYTHIYTYTSRKGGEPRWLENFAQTVGIRRFLRLQLVENVPNAVMRLLFQLTEEKVEKAESAQFAESTHCMVLSAQTHSVVLKPI